jgi:hypothetical protein
VRRIVHNAATVLRFNAPRTPDQRHDGTPGKETDATLRVSDVDADVTLVYLAVEHQPTSPQRVVASACFSSQPEGVLAYSLAPDLFVRAHLLEDTRGIPANTQWLLVRCGELFHAVVVLSGDRAVTTIGPHGNGFALEVAWSDAAGEAAHRDEPPRCGEAPRCDAEPLIAVATRSDPRAAADAAVRAGFSIPSAGGRHREQSRYPQPFDYLGWCTWDAYHKKIDSQTLRAAIDELRGLPLPIGWLLIDDGWLDVELAWEGDTRDWTLRSLEPDESRFPAGLAPIVRHAKDVAGIRWVGVWHTAHGYWDGITRGSRLERERRNSLVRTEAGAVVPAPGANGLPFWLAWYDGLRAAGVDFVKIDNQSATGRMFPRGVAPGVAAREAQLVLEVAVSAEFDAACINCMGMGTGQLWNRPSTTVSRNSTDHAPHVANSFREHAFHNVYNALIHGSFAWCDPDMWWSSAPDAVRWAVLAAVSGGPIYLSDPPDRVDPSVVTPLIDSAGRLLRCDDVVRPVGALLFTDPRRDLVPLVAVNRCGTATVIAAFHICGGDEPVGVDVPISDCVRAARASAGGGNGRSDERRAYVVYDVLSGTAGTVASGGTIAIGVDPDEARLLVVIPVSSPATIVGRIDKHVPPVMIDWTVSRGDDLMIAAVRESGPIAFARSESSGPSSRPSRVIVNGESRATVRSGLLEIVDLPVTSEPVALSIRPA